MELKVWVDGVVRVVCGLSLNTSCQDVVIALAQAIGQTGRYVLIMKLRGNERQLGAKDCPLQSLAQLGQQAIEVQFTLRRTGPSLSDGPNRLGPNRLGPNRHPLPVPKHPEPLGRRDHRKAVSLNLGYSTVPVRTKSSSARLPSHRASPEPRASAVHFPHYLQPADTHSSRSKEKVFRQILKQQERLRELEFRLQAMEGDLELAEKKKASAPLSAVTRDLPQELDALERTLRENEALLMRGEHWESQLEEEMNRERDMNQRIGEIHSSLVDYDYQLQELQARSAQLGRDVRSEARRRDSRPAGPQPEEALGPLRRELDVRLQQAVKLDTLLSQAETELHAAQQRSEERSHLIKELNKELRQCNLQQFIQQAGVPPCAPSHRDPRYPEHEQMAAATNRLSSAGILEPEDQPENVSVC